MTDNFKQGRVVRSNACEYLRTVMNNENENIGIRMDAAIQLLVAEYRIADALDFLDGVVKDSKVGTADRMWAAQKVLDYTNRIGY